MTKLILNGEYDTELREPWPEISEEAKDLVRKLMEPDPNTRIKAVEALNHSWFLSVN